jgi:hypothetical protein
MTNTKIELMETVISAVKQLAKPNDAPMLYFKNSDGKLIVTLLAGGIQEEKKYRTCLAIKALKEMSQCKEMVMVSEAWMAPDNPKFAPSENPNREECFVINYFSEDRCLAHILKFGRTESGKIVWKEEIKYDLTEKGRCESRFNPFKFKEKDVKEWLEQVEQDEMIEKGKKEKIKLPFDFEMVAYRYKGKALLQIFNAKKKPFMSIKPVTDDEEFKKMVSDSAELLNCLGAGKMDRVQELMEKMKNEQDK